MPVEGSVVSPQQMVHLHFLHHTPAQPFKPWSWWRRFCEGGAGRLGRMSGMVMGWLNKIEWLGG